MRVAFVLALMFTNSAFAAVTPAAKTSSPAANATNRTIEKEFDLIESQAGQEYPIAIRKIKEKLESLKVSQSGRKNEIANEMTLRASQKSRGLATRLSYFKSLEHFGLQNNIDTELLARLEEITTDSSDDNFVRIKAGAILVRSNGSGTPRIRAKVKNLAFSMIENKTRGWESINELLAPYRGDKDVEEFFLAALRSKSKDQHEISVKNATLVLMEKKGTAADLDQIISLLESGEMDETFARERGIYALASIGGIKAEQYLVRKFEAEQDLVDALTLLRAIGLTKTPGAKAYLLHRLSTDGDGPLFSGILAGLQFLGDSTTILDLEKFKTGKNLSEERLGMISFAKKKIAEGGIPSPANAVFQ